MGLEVFRVPAVVKLCSVTMASQQHKQTGDIHGSLHPALIYPDLKPDLNGECSLCRRGARDLNWLAATLGAGEHIAASFPWSLLH